MRHGLERGWLVRDETSLSVGERDEAEGLGHVSHEALDVGFVGSACVLAAAARREPELDELLVVGHARVMRRRKSEDRPDGLLIVCLISRVSVTTTIKSLDVDR